MAVCPAKTQISLGIRPVWSESLLSAWRKLGSLATQWVHCEDSDQTGWMPRLIWVFAGRTLILLVLSCRSSIMGNIMENLFQGKKSIESLVRWFANLPQPQKIYHSPRKSIKLENSVQTMSLPYVPHHEKTCFSYMQTIKTLIRLRE